MASSALISASISASSAPKSAPKEPFELPFLAGMIMSTETSAPSISSAGVGRPLLAFTAA